MRKDTKNTRTKMILAAEQLFAEQGVEAVSLNEITRIAGQKNKSALNYHFGGRDGLLLAVLDKHNPAIIAQCEEVLEVMDLRSAPTLENLICAVVYPLAAKLEDKDGGRHYLNILAQLVSNHSVGVLKDNAEYIACEERIFSFFEQLTDIPKELYTSRILQASSMLFHSLSYLALVIDKNEAAVSLKNDNHITQIFIDDLIDSISAVLVVKPSKATRITLAEAS